MGRPPILGSHQARKSRQTDESCGAIVSVQKFNIPNLVTKGRNARFLSSLIPQPIRVPRNVRKACSTRKLRKMIGWQEIDLRLRQGYYPRPLRQPVNFPTTEPCPKKGPFQVIGHHHHFYLKVTLNEI